MLSRFEEQCSAWRGALPRDLGGTARGGGGSLLHSLGLAELTDGVLRQLAAKHPVRARSVPERSLRHRTHYIRSEYVSPTHSGPFTVVLAPAPVAGATSIFVRLSGTLVMLRLTV